MSGLSIHRCPRCRRAFAKPEDLRRHLDVAHPTGSRWSPPAAAGGMWTGIVGGRPVPWQRTREGRRLDPRYAAWLESATVALRAQGPAQPEIRPVHLRLHVAADKILLRVGIRPPTMTMPHDVAPGRPTGIRGDLDNYVKATLDALGENRAGWIVDDRQVVGISAMFVRPKRGGAADHHDCDASVSTEHSGTTQD